jgi:hypothetical protein
LKAHRIKRTKKNRIYGDMAILLDMMYCPDWWYAVAHLVEAVRYKPEGRGFE